MVPDAPVMFSMTTFWPSERAMRSPITRAMVSVGPPAEYGTIIVTGRVGNVCAAAGPVKAKAATAAIMVAIMAATTPRIGLACPATRVAATAAGAMSYIPDSDEIATLTAPLTSAITRSVLSS